MPIPRPAAARLSGCPAHSLGRRGQSLIDAGRLMRIAAAFYKGADRRRRFRLAEQQAVHAAAEDLAELPRIEADVCGIGAVDRRLDDDCRRAVTRAGRAALDEPAHIFGEARHVERPVLHADIDVIGPDMRVFAPLRVGQHVAAMAAGVIDRLVLLQKFDGAVDMVGHGFPVRVLSGVRISDTRPSMSTIYAFRPLQEMIAACRHHFELDNIAPVQVCVSSGRDTPGRGNRGCPACRRGLARGAQAEVIEPFIGGRSTIRHGVGRASLQCMHRGRIP